MDKPALDALSKAAQGRSRQCPFCGATPHHGLTKVQHCSLHGEPFQRFAIWCPHGCARIERVTEDIARRDWGYDCNVITSDADRAIAEEWRASFDGSSEELDLIVDTLAQDFARHRTGHLTVADPAAEAGEVTQVDRDAAYNWNNQRDLQGITLSARDINTLVEAFARHRIAAFAAAEARGREAERADVVELSRALNNIRYEAERETGNWTHLKRCVAVQTRAALAILAKLDTGK